MPTPSKGAFDRKQTFFFPLVLAARLSPAQGRRSCQRLNLTHPFNLGGRNTFVPDNVHQMVAPGAPVAAAPDGWATGASPDLCLYVICIAAGGFSSHRQLRQHQPGRSDSPGMAVGTAAGGARPHGCTGIVAPEAASHCARGHVSGCARTRCLAAVGLEGRGEQSWCLPCRGDRGHPHCWQCHQAS